MSSSLERMWCENAMLLFVKSDAWSLISSTDLCRVARLPLKAWNNSSQLAITIHNQFKCNHTSKERWSTHKLYSNYFSIFWPLPPLTWIPLVMDNQGSVGQFIWIIFVQGSDNGGISPILAILRTKWLLWCVFWLQIICSSMIINSSGL